jgi:Flp pilus assembly protein TadD
MDLRTNNARLLIQICALLAAVTFATFWPVVHHPFITFDDPDYVAANARVASGLTAQNILWAFRTGAGGNWHPLTWLSHMLDVELFGLSAGGHHLTNLCFHAANSLLLFFALQRMTGALWRSALVAALFALHPLHVESVAWIAERKDVLSGFFFMLTLLAYARYAEETGDRRQEIGAGDRREGPRTTDHGRLTAGHHSPFTIHYSRWYFLSLLSFALGLMSKPMLVTLPFVLLLLDYWPLRRLQLNTEHRTLNTVFSLVWEKAPFFMLSFLSSAVTLSVQGSAGAIRPLARLSLADRLANTPVAYVRYLGKTFWPLDLAVFYPYPKLWPLWAVAGASLLLVAISALALAPFFFRPSPLAPRPSSSALRHLPLVTRHLSLTVGWLWFVGTFVPVIGLVQVGAQSMADRYTYLPLIGLFIALVWGVSEPPRSRPRPRLSISLACVLLLCLAVASRRQVSYWRSSADLFQHALRATGPNAMAHSNLGTVSYLEGDWAEAEKRFRAALDLEPADNLSRVNLALTLANQAKTDQAVQAASELRGSLGLEAHRRLGAIFLEQMKEPEAIQQYLAAVRLDPADAAVREKLGTTLAHQGRTAEASEQFAALVRLRPDAQAHYLLALSLVILGRAEEAAPHYREAIRLKPDWPEPLNDLAWMLATHSRAELRNGAEAVRLAERACELSQYKEARFVGTLDAAYAEAGRFAEAVTEAEQARKLALAVGDQAIAAAAAARLELYHAGHPYHQP